MSRPRHRAFNLLERVKRIREAGMTVPGPPPAPVDDAAPLQDRIRNMLHLLQTAPLKATRMTFLILYDIENNKVRNAVAKYLKSQGCIRIQKSVFLVSAEPKLFEKIYADLEEIQQYYDNNDSMILVPFNTTDARSMKIIGKDLQLTTILNKPNTLFF